MAKPASNGETRITITGGHTPVELARWRHTRVLAMQTLERARAMVEWADHEIKRLEKGE